MKEKILLQVMSNLEGLLPSEQATTLFALKLLVWSRHAQDPLAYPGPQAQVREMLRASGCDGALLQQGFPDEPVLDRLDVSRLQPALELMVRLKDNGVLKTFDPENALPSLVPPRGQEVTPPSDLCALLVELAELRPADQVYVPWDTFGQLATRCASQVQSVYLEAPKLSEIPALLGLWAGQRFVLTESDPLLNPSAVQDGALTQFDVGLALPPMGHARPKDLERDLFGRFPSKLRSFSSAAIHHLLAQVRRRVVLAVPTGTLFLNAEREMRQTLLQQGQVEAVVALPSGLLIPWTGINLALLVLNPSGGQRTVTFVDGVSERFRSPSAPKRAPRLTVDALASALRSESAAPETATTAVKDVLANDALLQIDRYVLPEWKKDLFAFLEQAPTAPLETLVTTVRPFAKSRREEDGQGDTRVFEVTLADLSAYGYITRPSRELRVLSEDGAWKTGKPPFLQAHDIVLTLKGTVGRVGIVPPDVPERGDGAWTANVSSIVLRVKKRTPIDPRVLFMQLRSPLGQALLQGITSEGTIPLIQMRELNRLELLIPDPETTRRALQSFEQEVALQHEIERLKTQQAQASAGLWALPVGDRH